MLIKNHLIYYALGYLLLIISYLINPLFYILFVFYCIFFIKKLNIRSFLLFLLCSIIIFKVDSNQTLPTIIEGSVIDIKQNYIITKTKYGKVKLYTQLKFEYNDTFKAKIKILKIKDSYNDNSFNEKLYLKANNIKYKASLLKLYNINSHYSLTKEITKRLSKDKDIKSYQKLFILGVKDQDIKDDYNKMTTLSIVHMFALSGMHLSILYLILHKILSLFIPKNISSIIIKILLTLYVFSIPYSISLNRALYMLILSDLLKHKLHKIDILSLLVILHILYNPYIIFSISFIFSYFIYFCLLLLNEDKNNSLLIYIGSIPIILYLNYQLNVLSLLLTCLLMPFIEVFYILTIISMFIDISSIYKLLIYIFKSILYFTSTFSNFITFQKPNILFILLFYYFYFNIYYYKDNNIKKHLYYSLIISLLISFSFYSKYKIYSEIGMINVGQGDCAYISLPFNKGNILIDTGGHRNIDVATYHIIPYLKSRGIFSLDYVYISHDDFDHNGALESLKKNFKVKKVITTYEKERQIGPLKIEMLKSDKTYLDKNDNSLIMLLSLYNTKYLFTGDISKEVENDLYEKYKSLDVDILKVSHHGSITSSSVELFELINPKIAFIGVGENNRYNHPSPIVIERLESRGIMILRTDIDKNFYIRHYKDKYYIYR